MTKTKLPNVTLIAVDTYNLGKAVASLNMSMEQCEFGVVKFLTNVKVDVAGIEVVQIPTIKSKQEYSKFIIKELYKYFNTDYVLITQHDSWVLDGSAWQDKFFDYDILGAAWLYPDHRNNSNGGFSLRSKRLQEIIANDLEIEMYDPEDEVLGRLYRQYLTEKHGIKYPTDDVCDEFAFELRQPKCKTFGFHGFFHAPYRPYVVLKRDAALGDCIMMEPIMRHYYRKGYNVVVDMPLEYYEVFEDHYFPVIHISKFDKGRIKPELEINLNLAYEVKPRQLYQKSYFEFCGIEDYELSRPILSPFCPDKLKPFKKFAVIHIDKRETTHRNIYGIDWKKVINHLNALGYEVVQIGKGEHEQAGIEYNTASVKHMKFLISSCDLFIGVDSAPSHIAVAYNKPSVIFFGSVNPNYIHPNLTDVEVVQGNCESAFCWHQVGGVSGKECEFLGTKKALQCCISNWETVVDSINRLIKKEK